MDSGQGIYVYGFGRAADVASVSPKDYPEVYSIEAGKLAAYGRVVDLSEYSEEALKARADDQAWLISQAQHHHRVIAALHQQAPILPAKFGSAYATDDDVREALSRSETSLLERLDAIEGCDEWAAHIYLEDADLSQIVVDRDPELKELFAEVESASEGRKYMLQQRMRSRIQEAIERYETEVADRALNSLRPLTSAFQVEPPREPEDVPEGETEIARASLLVPRDRAEQFVLQAEETNIAFVEIWLQITGPWPAYSFARIDTEDEIVQYG